MHHVRCSAIYARGSSTTIIIVSYKRPQIRGLRLAKTTMLWFAALLFLLGLSVLDVIVKSTSGPATPPPISPTSSSKQ